MRINQERLPASLEGIIKSIDGTRFMDSHILSETIKLAGMKAEDYLRLSNFNHEISLSYGRNLIYQGLNYSIYLMSWAPGDFTAIHSHGVSQWGAV